MNCIISCEHASNYIPSRFKQVFAGRDKVLSSHQAYDQGAAELASRLARQFQVELHLGTISRLLIDLNRSPTNRRNLYTPYSRKLLQGDRELLLQKYYLPYREKVTAEIGRNIERGHHVLHVSLHSFTPVKKGKVRNADIGLLYDPARRTEKDIIRIIVKSIQKQEVSLRVRRNYPYLGKTDGFASFLRRKYPEKFYAGIEIEINQKLLSAGNKKRNKIEHILIEAIRKILECYDFPN